MGNNYTICITGGPVSGITSMLKEFKKLGYIVVPEVAQTLIDNKIAVDSTHHFQEKFIEAQKKIEDIYDSKYSNKFLVCDRGAADAYGFTDDEFFESLGGEDLIYRYDCVIFARSVANVSEEAYKRHGRRKTAKEALAIEKRLYDMWSQHPSFHVIPATEDFEEKSKLLANLMDTLIQYEAFMSKGFQADMTIDLQEINMNREELIKFIKESGDEERAISILKGMKAENAPMTIQELERRMYSKSQPEKPSYQPPQYDKPVYEPPKTPQYGQSYEPLGITNRPTYEVAGLSNVPGEKPKKAPKFSGGGMGISPAIAVGIAILGYVLYIIGYSKTYSNMMSIAMSGDNPNLSLSSFSPLFYIGVLIILAMSVIAQWKIFEKANRPGWASIIPLYNLYVMFDIVFDAGWKMIFLFIPIVNIVFAIWLNIELGNRFNKGTGFKIGLVLMSLFFEIWLAFDDSVYA